MVCWTGTLAVDHLGPVHCRVRPLWIGLVSAHAMNARSNWDLGRLGRYLGGFIVFFEPLLSSFFCVAGHIVQLGKATQSATMEEFPLQEFRCEVSLQGQSPY